MLKKAFILALVAILVSVYAASTFGQDDEVFCGTDEEATIVVAGGSVGQELELSQAVTQRFMEACPNITVEVLQTPDFVQDRLAFYLQTFEAQSSDIDVLQIDVIWPGDLAEHLIDLGPYMTEEAIAAHFPAIVENNTVDGALVGIPWFTDAGLLYYRTDLLEAYGYDAPPATWDELTEMAQAIQDGERANGNTEFWGYVWQGNSYEGLTCDALEWQYSESGTRIVNPETGEVEVNNEGTIAAFERAAGWVGTISPDGVTSYGEEDARNVWQAGNAAFMRNWPYAYSLGNSEDSPIAGLFDVSPLPFGATGGAATLGGWQLAVSRYSENPDAAAALAVFMTSEAEQRYRAVVGSLNPTIMSLYQDEEVLEAAPFFGSLYDVFINAVARPSTVSAPNYNAVSVAYFSAVHSILTGEEDAALAMELLELDIEAILQE